MLLREALEQVVESERQRIEVQQRLDAATRQRDEAVCQAAKSALVEQIQLCERLLGRDVTDRPICGSVTKRRSARRRIAWNANWLDSGNCEARVDCLERHDRRGVYTGPFRTPAQHRDLACEAGDFVGVAVERQVDQVAETHQASKPV
jgi:hypothetical protein